MSDLFKIKDWYEEEHLMTDKELRDLIVEQHLMTDKELRDLIVEQSKKSNYNWLAPADELIKVCNNPKFNKDYAKDIKVAIVNYYANLMQGDIQSDIVYAYDTYNELFEYNDEQVLKVRKKFLKAFIRRNIIWNKHFGNIDETFRKAKDKWVDDTAEKLLKVRQVSFGSLKDDLVSDFEKYIDEEMDKGNVIEKYMSFGNIRTDPDKEVYFDIDDSQKQPYAPMNEISDEIPIKIGHEINNVDGYKPQVEKKPKSSKGIMKIFRRKRKK